MRKMCRVMCAVLAALSFSCGSVKSAANNPPLIADLDPFSLGSVNVWLDKTFSSQLKETAVEVVFIPRKNEVTLEFRHEMLTYRQFWNEAARQHYIEALSRYKEDFENKKLITGSNKTRTVYGKHSSYFEWETFKYSATYSSLPTVELGYRFNGNAVYFTVLQRSASETNSTNPMESSQLTMHFTRAQAEELAKLFDQDYLLELAGSVQETLSPVGESSVDEAGRDIYIP